MENMNDELLLQKLNALSDHLKAISSLHGVIYDAIELLKEKDKEIATLKAMGLKMPELTVLTDESWYKIDRTAKLEWKK